MLFDQLLEQIEEIDTLYLRTPASSASSSSHPDLVADAAGDVLEDDVEREAKRQQKLRKSQRVESLLRLNLDKTAFTATLSQENGKSSTATLRFYPVDIEVLFSASPFMKGSEQSKRFSYIAPTKQISVSFAAASNQTAEPSGGASEAALVPEVVVPLPPELRNTNCFVEAEYDGKTFTHTTRSPALLSFPHPAMAVHSTCN